MEHEDAADTSVACDSCDRWSDATCDSHPSQVSCRAFVCMCASLVKINTQSKLLVLWSKLDGENL
jgi:hypothetical protein